MTLKLLDKHRKDLLIFGWCRQNQTVSIPVVLIELAKTYYDDFAHDNFAHNEYKQFINEIAKYRIYPYLTHIYDISKFIIQSRHDPICLEVSISIQRIVRWRNQSNEYHLVFEATAPTFPMNILGYDINYTVHGNLLNTTIKASKYVTAKDSSSQTIKAVYSNNNIDTIKSDNIDLHYHFEILSVKYNSMKTYCFWSKTFTKDEMSNSGKMEINVKNFNNWNVNHWNHSRLFYGWTSPYKQDYDIFISPASSLPAHIKSFKLKCDVKMSRGNQKKCVIKDRVTSFHVIMDYYATFLQSKTLTISVSIEIMKIYDINDKSVKKSEWSKYGFVRK